MDLLNDNNAWKNILFFCCSFWGKERWHLVGSSNKSRIVLEDR